MRIQKLQKKKLSNVNLYQRKYSKIPLTISYNIIINCPSLEYCIAPHLHFKILLRKPKTTTIYLTITSTLTKRIEYSNFLCTAQKLA